MDSMVLAAGKISEPREGLCMGKYHESSYENSIFYFLEVQD